MLRLLYEAQGAKSGGASVQLESQSDAVGSTPVRLAQTRVLFDWVTAPEDVTQGRDSVVEVSTLASLQAGDWVFVACTSNIRVFLPASALNCFSALLVHGGEVAARW